MDWQFHLSFPEFETLQSPSREPATKTEPVPGGSLPRLRRARSAPAIVQTASNTDAVRGPRPPKTVDQDWQLVGLFDEPAQVRTASASLPNSPSSSSESEPSTVEVPPTQDASADDVRSDLE